jgi:hypothetical protein
MYEKLSALVIAQGREHLEFYAFKGAQSLE